jgi:hypothetical protein
MCRRMHGFEGHYASQVVWECPFFEPEPEPLLRA